MDLVTARQLRNDCTRQTVSAWIRENEEGLDIVNGDDVPSRRHYVYILVRGKVPFYVGFGTGGRWKMHWSLPKADNNLKKKQVIQQLIAAKVNRDDCVIFAKKHLTLVQAGVLEAALIAIIKRHPEGPLLNLSDGGESGAFGYKWTDEQRARCLPHRMACAAAMNTPEARAKGRANQLALIAATPPQVWINNGKVNRKLDATAEVPEGWVLDRLLSEEVRAANSAAAKLKFTSEKASSYIRMAWDKPESRERLMASRADQCWITNGTDCIRHWKSEPIPDGWRRGRIIVRETPKRWITNGAEDRQLDVTEAVPEGWQEGRREGIFRQTVWITNGVKGKRLPVGDPIPDGWSEGFPPRKPIDDTAKANIRAARLRVLARAGRDSSQPDLDLAGD